MALNIAAALLPILVFLAILYLMDSFKLVSPRGVAIALAAGAVGALVGLVLHDWLLPASGLPQRLFSRYVAPITEETLKAIYIIIVLKKRRLGFLVDAAIVGFAVGTGFAVVENLDYLRQLRSQGLILWVVRGFGPALLHGTSTTLFAILAKSLTDRHPERAWTMLAAALGIAIMFHSLFNHFPMPPIVAACVLLVVLPVIVTFVFGRSERATREWVGEGMDLDVELLGLLTSAEFGRTRLGSYLAQLRDRFPGPVVADMFCLLRIELELAVRAKGMLLARQEGVEIPRDPDVSARLQERRYLQRSIGATGLLALKPLRITGDRDDWHTYLLEQAGMDTFGPIRRVWQVAQRPVGRHDPIRRSDRVTRFSMTTDIEAPTERVWQIMSDVDRWHEWTPSITRIRRLGNAPFMVGCRALIRQPKLPPAMWRITEIEPGSSFTWVSGGPGLRVVARHRVEPTGTGSRAALSLEFLGTFGKLLGRLTSGISGRYLALEASGLKARSEDPSFRHS